MNWFGEDFDKTLCFDSILVRLKVCGDVRGCVPYAGFDSILVRLKVKGTRPLSNAEIESFDSILVRLKGTGDHDCLKLK